MKTLLHQLFDWSLEAGNIPAQAFKKNSEWQFISARNLKEKVENLARFLRGLGVSQGDVGLIYSYNCPEWVQFDLALMLTGASSGGIYVNASARQVKYILGHSEAKVLLVDSLESIEKYFNKTELLSIFPFLKKVIVIKKNQTELPSWAIGFDDCLMMGMQNPSITYSDFLQALNPREQAMLIYTSGTTGEPKGVSLTHTNLIFAAWCYSKTWEAPKKGRLFSFLPLAHIAERIANIGIGLNNRYTVYFCTDPLSIASEMREVQPSIALAVPRFWDKLKEGMEKRLGREANRNQKILNFMMKKVYNFHQQKMHGVFVSPTLYFWNWFGNKFFLESLRTQLGLGAAVRVVSGAASLSASTLEWYQSLGVRMIQAYALSETAGVLTCGKPEYDTKGTVGVPYQGIEICIGSNGEVQTRGPHVFKGYYKEPEATKKMFNGDWLVTGDHGEIDSNNCLKILGRKREIIKSAEGKMISPLYLEALLESHPMIDQAVVIGNEKPYLVALLTLTDYSKYLHQDKEIASQAQQKIKAELHSYIEKVNLDLASHERIRQFKIISTNFSIDKDEITATMKIKRRIIEERYHNDISSMYHC